MSGDYAQGVGADYPYLFCIQRGTHHYSPPHPISRDRKTWITACRKCGNTVVTVWDEENGQIRQVLENSSKKQHDQSVQEADTQTDQ